MDALVKSKGINENQPFQHVLPFLGVILVY